MGLVSNKHLTKVQVSWLFVLVRGDSDLTAGDSPGAGRVWQHAGPLQIASCVYITASGDAIYPTMNSPWKISHVESQRSGSTELFRWVGWGRTMFIAVLFFTLRNVKESIGKELPH